MTGRSSTPWYFAALLVVTAIVAGSFWKVTSGRPYFYDEADYMYAGTRGFINNYLDRPSLSTVEFVREGLRLTHDRSQGSNMSKFIRTAGDITFYRHYHGPVYAYWIALDQALGFHDESGFRGSGLLIHGLVAILIFVTFRIAMPEYAPAAALAAAVTFLMNRTALVAATNITQHVMFGLMAALSLLPLALFCRTGERRYWYWMSAAAGVAFATVETSFVLVAAVLFVLLLTAARIGWKPAFQLLLRGTGVFLLAMLVVWPKGILTLGGLKGYIYLAYIAIVKKTFTPLNPVALWSFKIRTYPEEFVIPFLALIAATIFWKKLAARQAAIPYLVYAWMFLGVTMVITAPYTYYHASLMMSCAVVTGIVFGEIWQSTAAKRVIASAVLVASLIAMDVRFHGEDAGLNTTPDARRDLMAWLKSEDHSKTFYVPYVLVPTLHFYMPEISTVGYDASWNPETLASAMAAPGAELLCEIALCDAVESRVKTTHQNTPVMEADKDLQQGPLYSLTASKTATLSEPRPQGSGQLLKR
ncbi:MAG TPA: glycosyltransferase family 39 protein [Bryobacteraceae bacterium]|nr:glycosyltransferase family 39 protein [Bryobacteraceae bacterium]